MEGGSSSGPEYWALLKGAPEIVEGFLEQAPEDFSACYREFASQGGRYSYAHECCTLAQCRLQSLYVLLLQAALEHLSFS